jgi:voltage-gated potassium channel
MFDVIFEADTPAGRRFDIALVFAIMLSILVVVLDSVPGCTATMATR